MTDNSLSFDELPGAVLSLTCLVKDLAKEVVELRKQLRARGLGDVYKRQA